MKNFSYKVKDKNNNFKQGSLSALNITNAAQILEKKGYIIIEIKEKEEETHKTNYTEANNQYKAPKSNIFLTLNEKKEFFNSFLFLYKSDYSFSDIFKSIMESSGSKNLKSICFLLLKYVSSGYSLKESLSSFEKAFGKAYITLIAAGEASGKLENILIGINENIKNQEKTISGIISASIYPAFIFTLALAVGLLFKFFVFKVFDNAFDGPSNNLAIFISALIKIAITFAVLFGIIFYIYKNKSIMSKIKNIFLNIEPFKTLSKYYYFANFFSVLSLAFGAGMPIAEAVSLANSVMNINSIKLKIKKAEKMIWEGCETTTAFAVANVFSQYAMSQISTGEKSGELDKTLLNVSRNYENMLNDNIKRILKLIEPAMILIIGIFVGFIAYTAYKKYFGYLSGIGGY